MKKVNNILDYLFSKKQGLNIIIYSIIFIIILIITLIATKGNFIISFLIAFGVASLLYVWTVINDFFGKKKHKNIFKEKKFFDFKTKYNFEIEKLNKKKYVGLKGIYKTYFIRCYYDWNITNLKKKSNKGFCFMIYYKPILLDPNMYDAKRLNTLNKKYKVKGFLARKYALEFDITHLKLFVKYNFLTNIDKYEIRLSQAIKILKEEKLLSINESEVKKLMVNDSDIHGPEISTFQFD